MRVFTQRKIKGIITALIFLVLSTAGAFAADTVVTATSVADLTSKLDALTDADFSGGNYIIELDPATTYQGAVRPTIALAFPNMSDTSRLIIRTTAGSSEKAVIDGNEDDIWDFSTNVTYFTISNVILSNYNGSEYANAGAIEFSGVSTVTNFVVDNVTFIDGINAINIFGTGLVVDGITIKNSTFIRNEQCIWFGDNNPAKRVINPIISNNKFIFNSNKGGFNTSLYGGSVIGDVGDTVWSDLVIRDNYFASNASTKADEKLLSFKRLSNITVVGNEVRGNELLFFYTREADSAAGPYLIASNTFIDNTSTGGDFIYFHHSESYTIDVIYNLFVNNSTSDSIFHSASGTGDSFNVFNNTFVGNTATGESLIEKEYAGDANIKNNIFFNNNSRVLNEVNAATGASNFLNAIIGDEKLDNISAISSSADPMLLNDGTYRLHPDSPAIDAGEAIAGVTDGVVKGSAPDVGFYEYDSSAATPSTAAAGISVSADTDIDGDEYAGDITVTNAADESNIETYEIYWASSADLDGVIEFIASYAKTGSEITHTIPENTVIPSGATMIMVLTKDENEMVDGVGYTFTDAAIPVNKAAGLSFSDKDVNKGEIGNDFLNITKASDESDITHYNVYFGTNATNTELLFASIPKTGSDIATNVAEDTDLSNFTHFVVITSNADGEMRSGIATAIVDWQLDPRPSLKANAVEFSDTDSSVNLVSGDIIVTKADAETNITSYELYWGSTPSNTNAFIGSLTANGDAKLTNSISSVSLSEEMKYIIAITKNDIGLMTNSQGEVDGVSVEVVDDYSATTVTASGIADLNSKISALTEASFSSGPYIIELAPGVHSGTVSIDSRCFNNMSEYSPLVIRTASGNGTSRATIDGSTSAGIEFANSNHYVVISNLIITGYGTAKYTPGEAGIEFGQDNDISNVTVDNVVFSNNAVAGIAVKFYHNTDNCTVRDISIINSKFTRNVDPMIYFTDSTDMKNGVDNLVISNCTFKYNTNGGTVDPDGGLILGSYAGEVHPLNGFKFISNNIMYNGSADASDYLLKIGAGTNHLIANNNISYNAINIFEMDVSASSSNAPSRIASNVISFNVCQGTLYKDAIDDDEYLYFHHNLVYSNSAASSIFYTFNNSSSAVAGFYNNTFVSNGGYLTGVAFHEVDFGGTMVEYKNNIFWDNEADEITSRSGNVKAFDNNIHQNDFTNIPSGTGNLTSDPTLTTDGLFTLQTGSPAIDAGIEVYNVTGSYYQSGIDIGYAEYVPVPPTQAPQGVSFEDTDAQLGEIGGDIIISNATDEVTGGVTNYNIYWSSSANYAGKMSLIAAISTNNNKPVTNALAQNTSIPDGAKYILVVSAAEGEMESGVSVKINDLSPPAQIARGATFTDTNGVSNQISGDLWFNSAASEDDITHYVVYFSEDGLAPVAGAPLAVIQTNGNPRYTNGVDTTLGDNKYFLVYASNAQGLSAENYPRSIIDAQPPTRKAESITFVDQDAYATRLEGDVVISNALSEVGIDAYYLYKSQDGTTAYGDALTNFAADGSDTYTYTITNGTTYDSADYTHFIVFTSNSYGMMSSGTALAVADDTSSGNPDQVAPDPFSLISPTDGAYLQSSALTAIWEAAADNPTDSTGISNHQLLISTSSDLSGAAVDIYMTGTNTNLAGEALAEGSYYWAVIAYDNAQNTRSTVTNSFTIDDTAPTAPGSLVPADSATFESKTIEFDWADSTDGSSGVKEYALIYGTNADLAGETVTNISTESTNQRSVTTNTNASIYYYVIAYDNAGNSSVSATNGFTINITDPNPPTAFDLTSPTDGSNFSSTNVTFTWEASTDADTGMSRYVLEIHSNSTFTGSLYKEVAVGDTNQFTTNAVMLENGTFYWRVIAEDAAGNQKDSLSTNSFVMSIDYAAPTWSTSPASANVASNAFDVSGVLNESGKVYYVVVADGTTAPSVTQLTNGKDGTGADAVDSGSVATATSNAVSFSVSGLSAETAYTVYMVTEDDTAFKNIESSVSTSINVTTLAPDGVAPDAFSLLSPADGMTNETTNITFVWEKAVDNSGGTGVTNYRLVVDTKADFSSGSFLVDITNAADVNTNYEWTVTNNDTYYWKVSAFDVVGNERVSATNSFEIAIDYTAPTWSTSPTASGVQADSFTIGGTLDESAKVYYVVLEASASAPTVADITNGTDGSGSAAIVSGTTNTSSGNAVSFSVSGLSAETAYVVYLAAQDESANKNIVTSAQSVSVTTIADVGEELDKVAVDYNPQSGSPVTVTKVPETATVKIYTLNGMLVQELEVGYNNETTWDLANEDGVTVSDGVYIAAIVMPDGTKKMFKLVIAKD